MVRQRRHGFHGPHLLPTVRTINFCRFVPAHAIFEMKANFTPPQIHDGFTEVEWIELPT